MAKKKYSEDSYNNAGYDAAKGLSKATIGGRPSAMDYRMGGVKR